MRLLHGLFGVELDLYPSRRRCTQSLRTFTKFQNLLWAKGLAGSFLLDTKWEQGLRIIHEGRKYQQQQPVFTPIPQRL
jgi:hypothetical protein